MAFWLMKSEPEEFSFDDLGKRPKKTEPWDGVRNYQARNFMRDQMADGDEVFFYHSNCAEPGIVGIARIHGEARADHTAFDPDDKHFDPKSDAESPRWFLRDVQYVRPLRRTITLRELKERAEELEGFPLVRRGNRLSVMPVDAAHWQAILELE
ncbi:MAG: EVE domain-containing protein [Oceanococcus sp.]